MAKSEQINPDAGGAVATTPALQLLLGFACLPPSSPSPSSLPGPPPSFLANYN